MKNASVGICKTTNFRHGLSLRLVTAACCFACSAAAIAGCNDGTSVSPAAATANDALALLQHRKFAELDQLAEKYSIGSSLGADGKPDLMAFYTGVGNGIANCGGKKQTEKQWKDHQRLLLDWRNASRHSAAPDLALAEFMTSYAWHARGSGYSSSVTELGQKLFDERVEEAKARLQEMDHDARNTPEWYVAMMTVALAQGWDKKDFEAVFREAVGKFPSYYPLYIAKASFYSPKWYGSNEEFQAFVNEAVKATAATLGEAMYTRLEISQADSEMFRNGQANWARMTLGFDRIISDFPGPWNLNVYAKYSCMAADVGSVRKLLGQIGKNVIYSAWNSKEQYESCRKFANDRYCWKWADDNTTGCEPLENVPVTKY